MDRSLNLAEKKSLYTIEEVQRRVHICSCALISPANSMRTIALRAPAAEELSLEGFSEDLKREIREHLCSYTEDILICEADGRALLIIPSLYPSSSLCIALEFDEEEISLPELLRLVECEECPRIFRISKHISLPSARMTPMLRQKSEEFFSLARELEDIFCKIGSLSADTCEAKCEIFARAQKLAYFVGCPIERIDELWCEGDACSLTDLPLYTAFLLSTLILARIHAPDRSARIELRAMSSAAEVSVIFESDEPLELNDAILEWERLSSERNMLFGCETRDGEYRITFHPLRRDWSYLGLKQNTQTI